jgi:hypothetical protein
VEHKEALQTSAVVSQLSNPIKAKINNFLSNSIVTSSKIISSILLTRDQLFRVEELTVGAGSDLVDDSGFEVKKDAAWHMFASTCLTEECIEGIIASSYSFV